MVTLPSWVTSKLSESRTKVETLISTSLPLISYDAVNLPLPLTLKLEDDINIWSPLRTTQEELTTRVK